MAPERLSRLQRRILAWLWAEERRTKGFMDASYAEVVGALAHDQGHVRHSLRSMERKGWIHIQYTPGSKSESVHLTTEGRRRASQLTGSCD
jgi:DNA-binding MarR family transcriptional regulator